MKEGYYLFVCEEQVKNKKRLGWKHGNTPKRFLIGFISDRLSSLISLFQTFNPSRMSTLAP
jgi:hypothetical protein